MPQDIQIYCDYMEEVRIRVGIVQAVLDGRITTGIGGCNTELIFLQLRKTLEVIAFASLSANKAAYSRAYANFAKHWRAKDMLDAMEKVNANFYPVALDPPEINSLGIKRFALATGSFLTRAEFVSLYNVCSKVLHKENPYMEGDPTIDTGYSIPKWVSQIQRLLARHSVELANGDQWVVVIPNEGKIQVTLARPADSLNDKPTNTPR
jgi:hypothetical protein